MTRRKRRLLIGLTLTAAGLTAYNAVVYLHARALTHFTDGGPRTEAPERLSRAAKLEALLTGVRVPKFTNPQTPTFFGLEHSTHRLSSSHGAELEVWRIPRRGARGTALVFHGYASGKAALLPVARTLHELGLETVLVDFRGSGGSSGFETTLGVLEADDVAATVAWVGTPSVLVGTSMGAVAILRAASKNGVTARAAILECPFGRLVDTVKARFSLMGVPSWPSAQLLVFWGGGLEGFEHEPVRFAKDLRCPTLVLHGEADPTVSVEQVREIVANLPGEKELVTFPGAGHGSLLGADPGRWRAAVAGRLDSLRSLDVSGGGH